MRQTLAATLALLALFAAGHAASNAQQPIDVQSSTATSDFPTGIRFQLDAAVPAAAEEVRLVSQIAPDGVRASNIAQCTGTTALHCAFELAASRQNVIIPGAEVTYFWSVSTGGQTQETPPQKMTYQDTRFQWKTLTQGNMTLWYYSGSEDTARDVLDAGYDSEQKSSALLETTVDYPVKLFYYRTAEEMQPAILADNPEGVITLGEVVYSDTAMISADSSPKDIARHEIAHVVQRAALNGAYDAPDWLIEGMAVYEQSQPIGGQREAIESGIDDNSVLSVRSMSSASSGALAGNVLLFYGESWSLVKFLIETYGEAKFAALFRAIDSGAGDAGALQQVYGFNQDGLENAWRESVGLPPREAPTPADQLSSTPNEPSAHVPAKKEDSNVALVVAIIAVTAVLAGAFLAGGVLLARYFR
jgi:hypothetical protein